MNSTISVLSAVTAVAAGGSALNPVSIDLNGASVENITLEVTILNKDGSNVDTSPGNRKKIRVEYAFSSAQVSSSIADTTRGGANWFDVILTNTSGGTAIMTSPSITKRARWINLWLNYEPLGGDVTVTVKANY